MATKKNETEKKETAPKQVEGVKKNINRKNFPASSFEQAIELAKAAYKIGAGEKVRRLTLFDAIGKSPDSGPSRQMITNSNKYGLTKGGYQADFIELTSQGIEAISDEISPVLALKAKFELSISNFPIFKFLYEKFAGSKIPSTTVVVDLICEQFPELDNESAHEAVETFIVNIKYLGLLQTISGAERLVTLEHGLEKIPVTSSGIVQTQTIELVHVENSNDKQVTIYENFENICFYITPIGDEDSEFRKHSDLFLESIITPALENFNLTVVRADQIDKPGTITNQIIEYIFKSKLVIADLSFHNPNVFYELALRHACRLPTVQLIRKSDRIPFDLSQSRTIVIDTTDIYSLVPKLDTHKAEIASQVRHVLSSSDAVDNPLTNVFPKIRLTF